MNQLKSKLLTPTAKFILLVFVLSALSFNHAFTFHLFLDDWYQILGALYYPEILKGYLSIHPISVLEFKLFSPLFEFNPYYWQFLGYLLKVIDALSMWVLMLALTKSKKVAFYACLIFAVFVVGIESVIWPSPHSSAIVLPLINLGFYLWIKSARSKISRDYFYALAVFAITTLAEPGRIFVTMLLAPIWEFLSLFQTFNIRNTFISSLRIMLLFFVSGFVGSLAKIYFNITSDLTSLLSALSLINLDNTILSLKNALFGWTLLPSQFTYATTALFLISMVLFLILFFWTKSIIYKNILFLSFWIILFYLPHFLTQTFSREGMGMESRYYAISSAGIVGLLAYGLSFFKSRYINWIIFLFLLFNIYVSNNTLQQHYLKTRSISAHNRVWDKIDRDVPPGEKISIFMYSGEDFTLRTSLLDWNNSIPFAVRRGIIKKEEYPIVTTDKNLIAKLICEKNVLRPSPFGMIVQKEPIPLSHVYAWELKNGELIERSEMERNAIKAEATCLQSDISDI